MSEARLRPPRDLAPQLPRGRTVRLDGPLAFPAIVPGSVVTIGGATLCGLTRTATPTNVAALLRFFSALPSVRERLNGHQGLSDELSAYLPRPAAFAPERFLAKARREFAVYRKLASGAAAMVSGNERAFLDGLIDIHRRLGTGANGFRNHAVATTPDAAGNRVVFPDHRQCLSHLRDLHLFLRTHGDREPALCALAAYVAVTRAHPFSDGNGRTARTLCNLILAAAGSRHFLPLHALNALTGGALVIKLRRAQYGGGWDSLLAFFTDATRLSSRLQQEEG